MGPRFTRLKLSLNTLYEDYKLSVNELIKDRPRFYRRSVAFSIVMSTLWYLNNSNPDKKDFRRSLNSIRNRIAEKGDDPANASFLEQVINTSKLLESKNLIFCNFKFFSVALSVDRAYRLLGSNRRLDRVFMLFTNPQVQIFDIGICGNWIYMTSMLSAL